MKKFVILLLTSTIVNAEYGPNREGTYCHTFDSNELCAEGLSCLWEMPIREKTHRDDWRFKDCESEEWEKYEKLKQYCKDAQNRTFGDDEEKATKALD